MPYSQTTNNGLASPKDYMQDTLKLASLAFSGGKPEECVRILKPLLDRSSPVSPAQLLRARDLFARSMFALGNRKEALQVWEGALEELATADAAISVPLQCNLAHGYLEAGRGEEAINMAASPQYRGYRYNLDICKRALSGGLA